MDPGAKLVAGYQHVMPTYQGRSPAPETAAIVEYIKSLRTDARAHRAVARAPSYVPVPGYDRASSR